MRMGLHEGDVLFPVVGVDHDVEAVLLEGDGDLSAVFVELVDAEVVFEGGDLVVLDHELPAPVELSQVEGTSLS